jgi:hypothetical protein
MQKNDDKSWIFVLLILLGTGFILFSLNSNNQNANSLANNPEHMKRVDGHLKDTVYNLEADQRQRQIEFYQQLNKMNNQSSESAYKDNQEFSLETDPNMQALTKELDRSKQLPLTEASPEQLILYKRYLYSELQKLGEAYREAYAEVFKENARRGGWEVELGPNYEVMSVKKIDQTRHPSLFQEGETGSAR